MTDDRKPDLTGLKARLADIDALAAAGERAQALEARGEVIARLEGVGRPGRLLLAQAVLRQAAALEEAGQSALSLKLLRRVEEEFGDVAAAGKPPVAALAGYRICLYHFKTGRYEEAVAAADRLVEKYLGDDAATYLLAEALLIKSGCFAPGQLDLPERQIESLATLLRHFGESERPRVRFYVPPAMYELGAAFRRRGDVDSAIKVWGDLFDRFSARPPQNGRELPFVAQARKIDALVELGRTKEAWAASEEVLHCLEEQGDREGALLELGKAVFRAAGAMERAGKLREALAMYTGVHDALLDSGEAEIQKWGVYALINAGVLLGRLGEFAEGLARNSAIVELGEPALVGLQDVIARAGSPGSGVSREREAWALLMRGLVLQRLGRRWSADKSFRQVVDRFDRDDSPVFRALVAAASDACNALADQ